MSISCRSRFLPLRHRLAPALGGFWLYSAALCLLAPQAMAAELDSLSFQHTPTNPAVEGWVEVALDSDGHWSQVETTEVSWRFTMEATWIEPPQNYNYINIQIKPASLPEPASTGGGDCGDGLFEDPCQAAPPFSGGYIAHDVVPHLHSGAKTATVTAPLAEIDVAPGIYTNVTGVCHTRRMNLLNNGASLHDLLAEGFVTDGTAMIATLAVSAAGGGGQQQIPIPFKVRCKGDPAVADAVAPLYQGSYATGFQVTGAKLHISPVYQNLTADCPVTVPLVAEFTATNTGNLQFRFVSASGKVSQPLSVSITGKTAGVYKALYEKHIQVPLVQGGGAAGNPSSGGGIVNQQAGGGFAVPTQPEEPLFPTSPSSGGMDQVQANPLAGNIHSESFRVEVVDPATGIVSAYRGYRITCKPKTSGIGTPKALQMQPKPPQPSTTTTPSLRMAPQTTPEQPQRAAPTLQLAPQAVPTQPRRVAPRQRLAPQRN